MLREEVRVMDETCIGCQYIRWHCETLEPVCKALGYHPLEQQWAGDVDEGDLEWEPVPHEDCPEGRYEERCE